MTDLCNRIRISGRLAATPEARFTASGLGILTARLAVGQGKDKRTGADRPTMWLRATVWGDRSAAWLALVGQPKGTMVTVEGRLTMETWTGNDGTARETLGITVDDRMDDAVVIHESTSTQPARRTDPAPPGPVSDEDIPF